MEHRRTIIVLGLTYNQIPLIQKSREMGYRTVAIGVGGGEPVASQYADAWFPIDTSDKEAVLELAQRERAVGLVTCGTSTAICTIAYVTEQLGLSETFISYDTAGKAVFKDRFRDCIGDLLPAGFSESHLGTAFERSHTLTYPLIVKPGDGGGGKGITIIEQPDLQAFRTAFRYAQKCSRSQVNIVEEFLGGAVLGAESFVLDGDVRLLVIADKTISPPPGCITLGVVFPSILHPAIQREVRRINEEAIKRLGINWGPVHIDMVINARREPTIIDVGPRLAGGTLMAYLVPQAYDYDFYNATIQLATGHLPRPFGRANEHFFGSRLLVTDAKGRLNSISYSSEKAAQFRIANYRQLVPNGSLLDGARDDSARLVAFTTKGASYREVAGNLDLFAATLAIDVN